MPLPKIREQKEYDLKAMTSNLPNPGTGAAARHLSDGIADACYIQLEEWFGGVWARVMGFDPPLDAGGQPDPDTLCVVYIVYDRYGMARRLRRARLADVRRFSVTLPADAGTVHERDRRIDFGSAVLWPTQARLDPTLFRHEYHPEHLKRAWELDDASGPMRK
jgi:hypothetical protein